MKFKPLPEQTFLLECFNYNPEIGSLTWRRRPPSHFPNAATYEKWNTRHAGKPAGSLTASGHLRVGINRDYLAHRIIWKMVTGHDPIEEIDHRNLVRTDNRFVNLREATHQENKFNKPMHSDNRCGYKGVTYDKNRGKFVAQIKTAGKVKNLGRFLTKEEAYNAYCKAAQKYFGEFNYHDLSQTDG
jgi:hypothetical protein